MCLKFCVFSIVSLLSSLMVNAQEVSWKQAKNWKLYDIHGQAGFKYSIDTLKHFQSMILDKDTMRMFCNDIVAWPKEEYSMWMGLYVATCETEDKKLRKIIISTYGGFFYDQESKRYYQVSTDLTSMWLEFLNDSSKRINFTN